MEIRTLLKKIKKIELTTRLQVNNIFAGEYHSRFKGQGLEFAEVREYVEGDDARFIDWNVTARNGSLFTKSFMEERELTLLLAIDVSPSMHYYGLRKKKINTVLLTAATLAFSALQNNDKVGLVLFADNIVQHYVPPAKGRKHVLRILRDIVEQPTLLSDKKYAETWFLSRIVKRKSALFFFVDMFYTFSYQEMQLLARKHDLSALLVEDDFFHKLPDRGTLLLQNREEKQHFWTRFSQSKWKNALEQQYQDRCAWQMQQWNQVKAQYSELRVSDDVFMQLKRFFKKRKRH